MGSKFRAADVQQLRPLDQEADWISELRQGTHFLVYPPGVDLYDEWERLHGYICRRKQTATG